MLRLPRDRPFAAQQDVDPGRVPRLDPELRVGAILAAAERDPVVDDDQLAVVAQVDPADRGVAHARDVLQGGEQMGAGLAQLAPAGAADEVARPERVDHDPAGHAPPCRGADRVGDTAAIVVIEPDVEAHVDVLGRGLDRLDQPLDRTVAVERRLGRGRCRVAQQHDAVAWRRAEAVDRAAQVRDSRGDRVARLDTRPAGGGQAPLGLMQPADPLAADAGLAEQQIGHHPDDRQAHDRRDPGHPRGRRAVRPGDRAKHGKQVDGEHADRDDRPDQIIGRTGHHGSLSSALDTQTVPSDAHRTRVGMRGDFAPNGAGWRIAGAADRYQEGPTRRPSPAPRFLTRPKHRRSNTQGQPTRRIRVLVAAPSGVRAAGFTRRPSAASCRSTRPQAARRSAIPVALPPPSAEPATPGSMEAQGGAHGHRASAGFPGGFLLRPDLVPGSARGLAPGGHTWPSPSSWPDSASCGSAPAALRNPPSTALAHAARGPSPGKGIELVVTRRCAVSGTALSRSVRVTRPTVPDDSPTVQDPVKGATSARRCFAPQALEQ